MGLPPGKFANTAEPLAPGYLPQKLHQQQHMGSNLEIFEMVLNCTGCWHTPHDRSRWKAFGKGLHFLQVQGQTFASKPLQSHPVVYHWRSRFFSNTLKLPHWSSHFPCWECDTENFPGAAFGKGYKEICLEKQEFQVYSHEECLADPWSDHPLFQLPWVSSKNVRGDPLHILFCKGLYSHVIGGILHYICYYEGPKKNKPKSLQIGLGFSSPKCSFSMQSRSAKTA